MHVPEIVYISIIVGLVAMILTNILMVVIEHIGRK